MLDETLADILVIDGCFLAHAFARRKTPEGRQLWLNIDTLWWRLCRQ